MVFLEARVYYRGQLDCPKLKRLYSVGYVPTILHGHESSTLEHMWARHSLTDCFRNRANITRPRVPSYVSTEAKCGMVFVVMYQQNSLRYGFRAGAKAILYGVNIYSLSQNFNEN